MMIPGTFEPQTPQLSGSIATDVLDAGPIPNPANIIRVTDAWQVHVTWSVTSLYPTVLPPPSGKWHVRVYANPVGPGLGSQVTMLDPLVTDAPLVVNTRSYDKTLFIGPNILLPGVYQIVTVITIDDGAAPPVPLAIAAFGEGQVVQFY